MSWSGHRSSRYELTPAIRSGAGPVRTGRRSPARTPRLNEASALIRARAGVTRPR